MARYTGPKSKIARKFGEPIFGPDKVLEHKNYPPGQHGAAHRRKKISEYGTQLREKQKAKYTYGLLERQFRILFEKAESKKGVTGEILLQLLECRLDNIVYRLGIAPTRAAARQLVSHRHITVNGHVCNIPSCNIRPGDIVAVREKSKALEVINESLRGNRSSKYSWLEWDAASDNYQVLGQASMLSQDPEIPSFYGEDSLSTQNYGNSIRYDEVVELDTLYVAPFYSDGTGVQSRSGTLSMRVFADRSPDNFASYSESRQWDILVPLHDEQGEVAYLRPGYSYEITITFNLNSFQIQALEEDWEDHVFIDIQVIQEIP